jgi:hypothetical protein
MNDPVVKPTETDIENAQRMLDQYEGWDAVMAERQISGCNDPPGLVMAIHLESLRRGAGNTPRIEIPSTK